jgi:hypothetical protein
MITVAGGDSFVWGIELEDMKHCGQGGHSLSTWPALLAQDSKSEYICTAVPGGSNDSIVRNIIKTCEKLKNQDIQVIVQWTFPWRFGFRFVEPVNWYNFDIQVINGKDFKDTQAHKFHKTLNNYGIPKFTEQFFKTIGTTEYWPVYSTIKEIVLLQGYLKSKNINYIFTAADNVIFENFTISKPSDIYVKNLYDQIDWDHWYWFPSGSGKQETTTPRGFYQWALENKYTVGPGNHPLEQAHKDAAELIREKFNELVKKSI